MHPRVKGKGTFPIELGDCFKAIPERMNRKPTLENPKTNVGKSENLRWKFPFPAQKEFHQPAKHLPSTGKNLFVNLKTAVNYWLYTPLRVLCVSALNKRPNQLPNIGYIFLVHPLTVIYPYLTVIPPPYQSERETLSQ